MATATRLNAKNARVAESLDYGMAFDSTHQHAPAADTAAVVTLTANSRPIVLKQIFLSYSEAPTSGSIKVADGVTTVWGPHHITAAGPQVFEFSPPRMGTNGSNMVVTLAAGGGTCAGVLSVNAYELE